MMSAAAPSELEVELAERIRERLPSVELIRFANSGRRRRRCSPSAPRARSQAGLPSPPFAGGGYHGSHDYAASIPSAVGIEPGGPGIPGCRGRDAVVAPFDDVDATRGDFGPHLGDLAAVIVEPVLGSGGVRPALREFLGFRATSARRRAALLVFDEAISFRAGYSGSQGRLGVSPT